MRLPHYGHALAFEDEIRDLGLLVLESGFRGRPIQTLSYLSVGVSARGRGWGRASAREGTSVCYGASADPAPDLGLLKQLSIDAVTLVAVRS